MPHLNSETSLLYQGIRSSRLDIPLTNGRSSCHSWSCAQITNSTASFVPVMALPSYFEQDPHLCVLIKLDPPQPGVSTDWSLIDVSAEIPLLKGRTTLWKNKLQRARGCWGIFVSPKAATLVYHISPPDALIWICNVNIDVNNIHIFSIHY